MINNTLAIGIQGVQEGIQGMDNAARRIARGGTDGPQGSASGNGDLLEPIVDLKLYQRSVEASAQVVKTADETLGTLLDINA
ncbi:MULTISPECIES: flagellar basal body rod C-terminal domain-containing protein [Marinobacter]|uniref:flagellar basal body rod C-terminal domain-containing protein n=1 Tax=Marinobacter TaxID=2742 RepID=UPI001D06AAD7|nr:MULTISPECIES: flagellar biosynthesis protein FlgE [Marinobacter]MCG8518042.1 flagellar biosynthesis protein FlgE [Pseudomonadales bacterium]MCK7568572.1 flagellar biosynthesis protein FlgE [Marinobacter xestospongiae]UDL06574.1 flagellar biosynthesis protein FlgE [Marinobacter sp. CA1]